MQIKENLSHVHDIGIGERTKVGLRAMRELLIQANVPGDVP